ncbi:MAG TPA: DUF481 domain-containing protein [Spirochaetota bacterium]|nr:DUF481 domain-containing protein [Spirochaetota bacterium]
MRFLISIFIIITLLPAQILNVEAFRKDLGEKALLTEVDISGDLEKNDGYIIQFGGQINFFLKLNESLFLFLNNLHLNIAYESRFVNNGYTHLRYNYTGISRAFIPEIFTQIQYNEIQKIIFRSIAGTGPRFNPVTSENFKAYLGTLYMFEYNKAEDRKIHHYDHRLSSYLSFFLKTGKRFSINSVVYYQPLFKNFRDFRIHLNTTVKMKIFKKIKFSFNYNFKYSSHPPPEVKKTYHSFTPYLTLEFVFMKKLNKKIKEAAAEKKKNASKAEAKGTAQDANKKAAPSAENEKDADAAAAE